MHPSTTVTPDLIDPVFYAWSMQSSLHQVTSGLHGPWSLFDANIYYPTPHAASYADVALGLLPLSLPLHLVVGDPIALLNLIVALAFILSAYGVFVLARLHIDAVVPRLAWLTPMQRRAMTVGCHVAYRDAVEVICRPPWRTALPRGREAGR